MAKLKILKENETNIDSTDISKFAFHSDYPVFKIVNSGSADFIMHETYTIDDGAIDASYTYAHNLGYIPMVMGWLELAGNIYPCNSLISTQQYFDIGNPPTYLSTGTSFVYCVADSTTLTIGLHNIIPVDFSNQYSTTFTAHWRLMADEY